ncbi:MAG: response regulator transcription factor [Sutterella wadsworthensis]
MTESEFDPAERDSALIRLVDDEPDVRAALSLMLEIEGWRCVSYASAREFLVENMDSPGCLVLDVRMPGMSGLDTAIQSLKRGAVDFLLKPVDDEKLLAAIASAVHKDRLRREGLSAELLKAGAKALSDRERHLLELISLGRSDARIASELGISERTVQGHRAKIYRKFGIHSGKVLEAMLPDIMRLIGR